MDTNASWPVDQRQLRYTKGKWKAKAGKITRNYPCLDHGSLTALTLSQESGRLSWEAVAASSKGKKLQPTRKTRTIFPATRPEPLPMPNTTIPQRADQGAHFLRTYFPDLDIPAEIIRDEIEADIRISRRIDIYDPYAGNLLEALHCSADRSSLRTFLCFPMGESNQDLNISPFGGKQIGAAEFQPVAHASHTFPTPIQQIVSSTSSDPRHGSHLAVRTLASTFLWEVNSRTDTSGVELVERVVLDNSELGDRPIVDVKISSSPGVGMFVNDQGAVYRCDFGNGWKSLQMISGSMMSNIVPDGFFWGLSLLADGGCILASENSVKRLDWRTNDNRLDLFSLEDRADMITSVEGGQEKENNLIRLCTTSEIIWMDVRSTGNPLLGYKHGRSYDRTLATRTTSSQTYLTSRKNGLVTIYDVSRSSDGFIRSNVPAYHLPPVSGYDVQCLGYSFIQHPSDTSGKLASLYQLTGRGSIHCVDLSFESSTEESYTDMSGEWPASIQGLAEAAERPSSIGPLGSRDATRVDLQQAYQEIFNDMRDHAGDSDPASVDEIPQAMGLFWHESGLPQHMLTLFDVAFDSSKRLDESRAAFLIQSNLNCAANGRIPRQYLQQDAPWHYNATPTLKRFDPDILDDPQVLVDHLRQYDLDTELEEPLRMQKKAREQLALDLILATDVYAPRVCTSAATNDLDALETMSRAAEAMSLADELPPVHFGYLQPNLGAVTTNPSRGLSRTTSPVPEDFNGPLGVRLLLKEWNIGADPDDYTYEDPYEESKANVPARRRQHTTPLTQTQGTIATQSQRPPMVIASKSLIPPIASFRDVPSWNAIGAESQPQMSKVPVLRTGSQVIVNDVTPSSQDFLSSTQILPGPFGGRQAVKKKATKKRLGGF